MTGSNLSNLLIFILSNLNQIEILVIILILNKYQTYKMIKSGSLFLILTVLILLSCNQLSDKQNTDEAEFQSLFNGRNLSGWEISPYIITSIEDQILVISNNMRSKRGFLLAEKEYANFHLKAEVLCSPRINGGIVFRHNYLDENQDLANGYEFELYNTNNTQNPTGSISGISRAFWIEDTDPNAWNQVEVIAQGDYLSTYINGTKVTETHNRRSYKGKIGFVTQAARVLHQYKVRNIYIKELPPIETISPQIEDVMRSALHIPPISLFDGNNISKWDVVGDGEWKIENGIIIATCPDEKFSFIKSKGIYKNFYLKLKFKIAKEHNSGVFIRHSPDSININLNTGLEINIYDSNGYSYSWPTGSVVGKARAYMGLVDYEEWNTMEVFAFENHICTYINGIKASEHYTSDQYDKAGNICLQVGMQLATEEKRGSKVEFKDIKISDFAKIKMLGY